MTHLKRSDMARVNEDHTVLPATHTFIHKWNTCFYSPVAEHHRTLAGTYFPSHWG